MVDDDTAPLKDAAKPVQWFSEAVATAFGQQDTDAAAAAARAPKVAWQEVVPVLDVRNARSQHDVRAWADQMQLLSRREAMLAAEAMQGCSDALRAAFYDVQQEHMASDAALRQLRRQLLSDIAAVKQAVGAVNALVAHARPGQGFVAELAAKVDRADAALADVKRAQAAAFRALMEQEAQLEDELEAATSAMLVEEQAAVGPGSGEAGAAEGGGARRAWGKSAGPGPQLQQQRQRRRSEAGMGRGGVSTGGGGGGQVAGCLAPEVAEFEEFVQRHGETGGWRQEDHDEFVRVVKACGGDYARAVAVCMEQAVGYSRAELMHHATWHMDYMDLLVRKRAAVARWREERERSRAKAQAQAALLDADEGRGDGDVGGAAAAATAGAREQQVRREMVAQWKAEQAERRRAADAEAAETRRRVEERARLDREERQLVNKARLAAHRQVKGRVARQAQMWAVMAAEEAAEAGKGAGGVQEDPATAFRLQERNNALLLRRHALVAGRDEARRQRADAQERLLERARAEGGPLAASASAAADPGRVLRGTAAHMQRVAAQREHKAEPRDSGFILKVSHLAVPTWARGVTQ